MPHLPFSDFEKSELLDAFSDLDIDGDGIISCDDLITAFASLGDHYHMEHIKEMIAEVDNTGQGKIKLNDFLAALSP